MYTKKEIKEELRRQKESLNTALGHVQETVANGDLRLAEEWANSIKHHIVVIKTLKTFLDL